jgi:VWFA-related protein
MRTLLLRLTLACGCVAAVAAQQPPVPAQQPPTAAQNPPQGQQQQPPVFRAGVKVVRVDATVTGKGDQPAADLQAADFEVTEDGVPQKVDQVEFIRLTGQRPSDGEALTIRSQAHAEAEAAREDVRLFAIFLDDYHVDKTPEITIPLRRDLVEFVRHLWPTDLVTVMDPLTALSALKFTRDQQELVRLMQTFEGRQGELFPIKSRLEEAQLTRGDIRRVRAEVTLSALAALTIKLGGLREGRKTILFVSQGPPTYLGPMDGNLQHLMRDVTDAANRGNVTIYCLDPRTLGNEYRMGVRDTLMQLAAETGGRAIINTNDFSVGLGRLLSETSAYYILGYTPTRTEDDGKFHKINVKVRRSGLHVMARQGYWAPSPREVEAAAELANRTREPGVARALDSADNARATKRVASVWLGTSKGTDGKTRVNLAWEPSESTRGQAIASLDAEFLPAAGGAALAKVPAMPATIPGKPAKAAAPVLLPPGLMKVRFVAKAPEGGVIDDWTDQITIEDLARAPVALATPRVFRARSFLEWKALQAEPDPQPSALWQFRRTERALVTVECYAAGAPAATAHILSREGKELTALPLPEILDGKLKFELPVSSLGQGTYLLRLRLTSGDQAAEQTTAFQIVQ